MKKRYVAAPLLAALAGGAWWALRPPEGDLVPEPRKPALVMPHLPSLPAQPHEAAPAPAGFEELKQALSSNTSETLDPKSDAFRERVDEIVPRKLYHQAAQCYHGGLHRNKKMKVLYDFRVVDGVATFENVRLMNSNMNDPTLERCILDTISKSKFQEKKLPDMEETEQEMLFKVRAFKKHLEPALGEEAGGENEKSPT